MNQCIGFLGFVMSRVYGYVNYRKLAFILLFGCSFASYSATVLVQGAMDVEIEQLKSSLKDRQEKQYGGWYFWQGTLGEHRVVISRTEIGLVNAAAATTLGIIHYQPDIIINQGTAGGLVATLQRGDLVIVNRAVNVGAFRSEYRARQQGSDPQQWIPFDVVMGLRDKQQNLVSYPQGFSSDRRLIELATNTSYTVGKKVVAALGSADAWHKEMDRIDHLAKSFDIVAEDMETSAAAQIATAFQIPFIAIRIISDSEANQQAYLPNIAVNAQEFIERFLEKIPVNFKK